MWGAHGKMLLDVQIIIEFVVVIYMIAHFIVLNSNRTTCGDVHDKRRVHDRQFLNFPTVMELLVVVYMINKILLFFLNL